MSYPKYAMFRGRKVRVVDYKPAELTVPALFRIVDTDDTQRSVRKSDLTFLPEPKLGLPTEGDSK